MTKPSIDGFLDSPEKTAAGQIYVGRLCCEDVQITGSGADTIATFTITVRQLLDAANADLIWTDQDVQRGVRPEISGKVDRELSISNGYPDSSKYIFSAESADDMTEKLLHGKRLFINPLIWNLRPGKFEAYYDHALRKIHIYDGKIYLPDSHHRHQAILKAAKIYRSAKSDYPQFSLDRQFKVELYFLKREDEGNYFFDKNQRPTPTAKSKAYDLTTIDDLSMLAKRVIDLTPAFAGNVNRVTDRLTAKNPNLLTLSTLRESLKSIADLDGVDETELDGLAHIAAQFFKLLTKVRPELNVLPMSERKLIREKSLVDSPIMFQGYGALVGDFSQEVSTAGMASASSAWTLKLDRLGTHNRFSEGAWVGDLFEKANPMWSRLGVVKPGLTGHPTVSNNRAARLQVSKALRMVVNSNPGQSDLTAIVL